MEIKHDKSYLHLYEDWKKAGFTNEVVGKICIQGNYQYEEYEIVKKIADYLESNYKMYQYIKNNGVKFGEEDLFFWTNERERMLYFDLTIKADTLDKHNFIVHSIVQYLEQNYSESQLYIRLQYTERKNWKSINKFLGNEFDIVNLPIDKLRPLYGYIYSSNQFTKENIDKLHRLSEEYIGQFEGKKVCWNNDIKGTIKKIGDTYGLFKPRATRTYYPLDLSKINSLVLI